MAKMVKDVLGKAKGDKIDQTLTGKGSFSKQGFGDLVSALANDTTFKINTYGKDGKPTGTMSISDLLRADMKRTMEKAKWPQKSEAAVLDTCEISTSGLAEAIPQIVMQQISSGKKFDLPCAPGVQGSVYLATVPAKTKEIQVRDPKTQANLGSATITTDQFIQVRAKSPAPGYLQKKVRKDANGKVID